MLVRIRSKFVWRACFTLVLCGFFTTTVGAQDPDPMDLVRRMGNEISALQSYSISGDAYADARLDAGLIIEHSSQATMQVRMPDTVRITNRSSEDSKVLFFKSGSLTVYTQSKNFYGQIEVPEGTTSALDYAVSELGIDLPMLDFLSGKVAERMLANAPDVMYLGTSLIRSKIYEHVVIRSEDIDVHLWIAAESPHLPGKMAISAKWDGGSPRTVVFMEWDTAPDFSTDDLQFEPPKDATRITFESRLDSEE